MVSKRMMKKAMRKKRSRKIFTVFDRQTGQFLDHRKSRSKKEIVDGLIDFLSPDTETKIQKRLDRASEKEREEFVKQSEFDIVEEE